jgi:two-component system chemotaxis response regulator CheB
VLSGVLDDGTAGLMAIKRHGGLTMAQDPAEALYANMPRSAIDFVRPDVIGTVKELGRRLSELAQPMPAGSRVTLTTVPTVAESLLEVDRGASDRPQPGEPTGLTCPECSGGIWESVEDGILRLRCRVGHEFGAETLIAAQADQVEIALWTALRALEERVAIHRRMATRLRERGSGVSAERFAWRADQGVEHAVVLRELLGAVHDEHVEDDESVA